MVGLAPIFGKIKIGIRHSNGIHRDTFPVEMLHTFLLCWILSLQEGHDPSIFQRGSPMDAQTEKPLKCIFWVALWYTPHLSCNDVAMAHTRGCCEHSSLHLCSCWGTGFKLHACSSAQGYPKGEWLLRVLITFPLIWTQNKFRNM